MAKLSVSFYSKAKAITGFDASGHAGYAKAGSDIVCSAVSALVQGAAMGLSEYLAVCDELIIKDGHMRLRLRQTITRDEFLQAQAILETTRLGLVGIRREFPEYLEIVMKEEP